MIEKPKQIYVHSLQIEFGGFPRSGHGYFYRCLLDRYATIYTGNPYRHHFAWHREFIRSGLSTPFIVPVRDPKEALVSNVVRGISLLEEKNLKNKIDTTYNEYLHEVDSSIDLMTTMWETVASSDRFFIAPFTEIISNKDEVIRRLEIKHPELKTEPFAANRSASELLEVVAEEDKIRLGAAIREIGHVPRQTSVYKPKAIEVASDSTFKLRLEYLYTLQNNLLSRYEDIA